MDVWRLKENHVASDNIFSPPVHAAYHPNSSWSERDPGLLMALFILPLACHV